MSESKHLDPPPPSPACTIWKGVVLLSSDLKCTSFGMFLFALPVESPVLSSDVIRARGNFVVVLPTEMCVIVRCVTVVVTVVFVILR